MIRVNMKGNLARQVRAMKVRSGDLGPVLDSHINQKLLAVIKNGFRNSESPNGEKWKELAESTIEKKRDARRPRMLEWSGKLKREIIVRREGLKAIVGYSPASEYGQYHQWPDRNDGQRHTYISKSRTGRAGFVPKEYTRQMPLRRFLPLTGPSTAPRAMRQGPMATWFEAVQRAVKTYIETGKIR